MKKTLSTLFILVALFFAGCNDEGKGSSNSAQGSAAPQSYIDGVKKRGVVRIAVFGDKPPFGYIDETGKNAGYDVYFAKRIAKELLGDENKVQFVLVEAANRAEFLASDKVDITLANFTVTPERKEVVDFALPYMKVALGVASKGGDITDVSQLKNKTLLINKGTTADLYFTKNHPEIKLLKFDQNTETFGAMLDGRGDAIAHDNTLLFAWTKSNPGFKVGIRSLGDQDVIAPAVKKGNDELRKWLDDLIVKLADEKFFHADYDATLAPVYGEDVKANDVVIEGGKL
nr:cysteine ABC transporter substrate-binding protein [uncultured Campylobacter sp.]